MLFRSCINSSVSYGVMKYTTNNLISLSNVTSNASGSPIGISNVDSFTVYWNSVNQSATPNAITEITEISPDSSTWFIIDSNTLTTSTKRAVACSNVNGFYVRARTTDQINVTVNATVSLGSVR